MTYSVLKVPLNPNQPTITGSVYRALVSWTLIDTILLSYIHLSTARACDSFSSTLCALEIVLWPLGRSAVLRNVRRFGVLLQTE